MAFKLMLMLSIIAMITRYVAADAYADQGSAIMESFAALDKENGYVWVPTGPTAEDIQAAAPSAAEAARYDALFKKRDLGAKLRPAVAKGDLNEIKAIIAAGAELDVIDYSGITPLMAAVQKGDIGIVKMLISAGANIDAQGSSSGSTALLYAVDKGDIEIAKLLIAHGAAKRSKIGFRDFSKEFGGWFLNALRFGDNEMAKALMPLVVDADCLSLQIDLSVARSSNCSAEIVNAIDDLLKKKNS